LEKSGLVNHVLACYDGAVDLFILRSQNQQGEANRLTCDAARSASSASSPHARNGDLMARIRATSVL
jgi:hypothetical protein